MAELFYAIVSIPVPFNMVILLTLIGCGAGVISSTAAQVRQYLSHREELEFKRELLVRGMTADEIVKVIGAKRLPGEKVSV